MLDRSSISREGNTTEDFLFSMSSYYQPHAAHHPNQQKNKNKNDVKEHVIKQAKEFENDKELLLITLK